MSKAPPQRDPAHGTHGTESETTVEEPFSERSTAEHLMWLHRTSYPNHPIKDCFTCDTIADVERQEAQLAEAVGLLRKLAEHADVHDRECCKLLAVSALASLPKAHALAEEKHEGDGDE